jgi:hypothetical protein
MQGKWRAYGVRYGKVLKARQTRSHVKRAALTGGSVQGLIGAPRPACWRVANRDSRRGDDGVKNPEQPLTLNPQGRWTLAPGD